ncbi:hypothetical protein EDEG_03263 [Edhazardia aedis USNM 41457]|uniref:Uncharacterized protein n=1 Tax=Edhazardia aedis (strain USNM 41457) TaxID=1003232 RepID=J9D424_EDHAE|nr:hypothetical protein EDEG_03263 [Edhazardia aedis USNM 41457]|eukprot:EJW02299.1 hypothetical protein EDEG_03263 [Edhazardia aedis USNM 41457]
MLEKIKILSLVLCLLISSLIFVSVFYLLSNKTKEEALPNKDEILEILKEDAKKFTDIGLKSILPKINDKNLQKKFKNKNMFLKQSITLKALSGKVKNERISKIKFYLNDILEIADNIKHEFVKEGHKKLLINYIEGLLQINRNLIHLEKL